MAANRQRGVLSNTAKKGKQIKPYWTEVYLGLKPEVALGVLFVAGWTITLILDQFTDVMDKVAIL